MQNTPTPSPQPITPTTSPSSDSNITPSTIPPKPVKKSKNWPVILLSTFFILLLGFLGLNALDYYRLNRQLKTPTTSSPLPTPKTEIDSKGEIVELNQSPIISNPLNTSNWETISFDLSRMKLDDNYRIENDFTLTFTIPPNWKVLESNRRSIEFLKNASIKSKSSETVSYQAADYTITNPSNTLTMSFSAITGGTAEWYPLPLDAILVDTYIPSPGSGAKLAWILRYKDLKSEKIIYAETLSDFQGNPLTLKNAIKHWINLNTNPLGSHNGGVTYTIEMAYTGDDKDYGVNISTADQIISLLAGIDRN